MGNTFGSTVLRFYSLDGGTSFVEAGLPVIVSKGATNITATSVTTNTWAARSSNLLAEGRNTRIFGGLFLLF